MVATILRVFCPADEMGKDFALQRFSFLLMSLQLMHSLFEEKSRYRCKTHVSFSVKSCAKLDKSLLIVIGFTFF